MTQKLIFKKRRSSLVVAEMLAISSTLTLWLRHKYDWDWAISLLLDFGLILATGFLFFKVRVFRYIMSILFSLFWATLALFLTNATTHSHVSPWLMAAFIFFLSLLSHKRYFRFERDAQRIEYDER